MSKKYFKNNRYYILKYPLNHGRPHNFFGIEMEKATST